MSIFAWWCFAMGALFAIAWGFGGGYGKWRYKKAAELHACTKVPPEGDARKSANSIGTFLYNRAWVCNMGLCSNPKIAGFDTNVASKIFWGHYYPVIHFIRLCHALGCEVVVRQVNDDASDIEEGERTEVRSVMRKEWYAAYEKYDRYMGSPQQFNDTIRGGGAKPFHKFYPKGGLLEKLAEDYPEYFKNEYP